MGSTHTQQANVSNWFIVVLAAIATGILWQHPMGQKILWPFTLLATWVHEMGHAVAAMFLADFVDLQLFQNGGGVARLRKFVDAPFSNATIAAAGLMGPSIAGSIIILFGRTYKGARYMLFGLSVCLILSAVFCVRWTDFFSLFVIGAWGGSLMVLAIYGADAINFFAVQFLGIQFSINAYKDIDYMFSAGVRMPDGTLARSDSAAIGYELGNFLPYWFCGGVTAISSILLLLGSLYLVFKWEFGEENPPSSMPDPILPGFE